MTDQYNAPKINLSESDRQSVNNGLRMLQDLKPLQDKVAACGVDCSGYELLRQELRTRLEAIKSNFMERDPSIVT